MALCGNHFFYFYDLSGGQRGFLFFFFFNLTFFVHGEAGLFVFTKELCLWLCSLGVI